MHSLELLGLGVGLAWIALPLLVRAARMRADHEPASAYRKLLAAFAASTGCVFLPWARHVLPRASTPNLDFTMGASAWPLSPWAMLAVAWAIACALSCVRWGVAALRLRRLLARCTSAPESIFLAHGSSGAERRPTLLLSAEARAPFTTGVLSPTIVLPTWLLAELERDRLVLVLEHELAHVRRHDPLTNLVARVCAAFFTLHPAAPRVVRELSFWREAAVDDRVARRDRHRYATLLVDIAARFGAGVHGPVAMDDTELARRIRRILDRSPRARSNVAVLAAIATAVFAAGAFSSQALAQERGGRIESRSADESGFAAGRTLPRHERWSSAPDSKDTLIFELDLRLQPP